MERFEGTIAAIEWHLMVTAFWLMMIVVVPVIVLTLFFAWRYRATNTKATYAPDWDKSTIIDVFVWGIPIILIAILGTMVWNSTNRLDPYKPIASDQPATRVQAVAQNWKWLFIYPDLGIATVNELAFPQDRPMAIQITSDVAMNSFMIPALGGQIYAMAGMETKLHLWSDKTGSFDGRNMLYSGDGFSDQTFKALAMSTGDFDTWVAKVKAAPRALTDDTYTDLQKPSISDPVTYYKTVVPDLFQTIIASHAHSHGSMIGICE